MNSSSSNSPGSPLHTHSLHDSGYRHTSGEALYVDDMPTPPGTQVALIVTSPHAHARILDRDGSQARQCPGVGGVYFWTDVPGTNRIGPIFHDEALLAEDTVEYVGQAVALVVGDSYEACRHAAALVQVSYEPLPALFTIADAIEAQSFLTDEHVIQRGDVEGALEAAATVVEGEVSNGAQDHFYLETQVSLAMPGEAGAMHIHSSSQHPTEVQKMVAAVLGLGSKDVVCEVQRMGGAFGGKESQATQYACLAALAARQLGKPVKVWLNRDDDMTITGKRHPFWSRYSAGFDGDGQITALKVEIYADGGFSIDLSGPIVDRALFHLDNSYFLPNLQFRGRAAKTNLPSNTAFRGFGGPQGMLVIEDAIQRYAETTGVDPLEVRRRNYYGESPRNLAPYGQEIRDCRLERVTEELLRSSEYGRRREEIEAWNEAQRYRARGIAFQPVKFGISFTKSILNQAGALVHVYTDGTVQLNHGGTEMGQGLHMKMITVCAHGLGVTRDAVRIMNTATDKVPNTSATAASSGSDLNGQAVADACATLRSRMLPIAADLLGVSSDDEVSFAGGFITSTAAPGVSLPFAQLANECWLQKVSLSATGFYRTPGVAYDHATGTGTPFYYFAYGAAVVEVEISALTGEHRVLQVDLLQDVGASLVPGIDLGQVEGAFIQGLGWLTMEEVLFHPDGRPITTGPSTYKIPAIGDTPLVFNVHLLERAPQPEVIHGSKAVGEPPFMLAIGALGALRHGIQAFGPKGRPVSLQPPCTPEALLRAIEAQQGD